MNTLELWEDGNLAGGSTRAQGALSGKGAKLEDLLGTLRRDRTTGEAGGFYSWLGSLPTVRSV